MKQASRNIHLGVTLVAQLASNTDTHKMSAITIYMHSGDSTFSANENFVVEMVENIQVSESGI